MNNRVQNRVPLTGYSDRLSARAGDTIAFKLSAVRRTASGHAMVNSWLTRSICADANPNGPGIIERSAESWYKSGRHKVHEQTLNAGSYAVSSPVKLPASPVEMHMSATIWPTLVNGATQCIMAFGSFQIVLEGDGRITASFEDHRISTADCVLERQWLKVSANVAKKSTTETAEAGSEQYLLSLSVQPLSNSFTGVVDVLTDASLNKQTDHQALSHSDLAAISDVSQPVSIAACQHADDDDFVNHFNGKLETPELCIAFDASSDGPEELSLQWDFSKKMNSCQLQDVNKHGVSLELHNFPARAMKGSLWRGDEMCWRHAPEQYAAIHFHDDDIVNAGWQTTFCYTIPDGMPSGVYVMRISDGEHEDAMPFFVCPPRNGIKRSLCVLASTFTYSIYGNHARPDWHESWQEKINNWNAYPHNPAQYPGYGLSTYNNHSDGSGICHASHLRPLFNLRPGYITFGNSDCSGLRHFQADSHLIAWLDAMDIEFDIITDQQLHEEGVDAISSYKMLMTGSHPEYHTAETLNALQQYRDTGGHLSYLGGNGFYWRIALHPEHPDTLEIRRAEAGIRAWAAETGEYYHAFDGQYGGLWRRNGRAPQALAGVGFSAQGQFNGSYYRRVNTDPAYNWIFKEIEGDIIGDFGLSGNGAAGFELDRADVRLGTPGDAVLLASSEAHSDDFMLVPEEMLTHITTLPGPPAEELIRADIVWYNVPGGGSVFSVGSITFCGSLPHNNFDNTVSQLLKNVVGRVLTVD